MLACGFVMSLQLIYQSSLNHSNNNVPYYFTNNWTKVNY